MLGGIAVIVIVMDACSGATWVTKECEVRRTGHVHRRERCTKQADPKQVRVSSVADVVDDLVLRPETGERDDTGQGERRDAPGTERDRHELAQTAHVLLHVEGVVRARVADRASGEEQAALEECVGEHVEDSRQPGTRPKAEHHVAELTHRRVGEHLLDVVLNESEQCRDDDRDAADDGNEAQAAIGDVETFPEHRVDTSHQEDSGDDHGRRVKQRRDRGGAGHGVGQPCVERKLTGFADGRNEQRHRRHQERPA